MTKKERFINHMKLLKRMYFIEKAWRYTILIGEEWKIRDRFAFKIEHHNRG